MSNMYAMALLEKRSYALAYTPRAFLLLLFFDAVSIKLRDSHRIGVTTAIRQIFDPEMKQFKVSNKSYRIRMQKRNIGKGLRRISMWLNFLNYSINE